VGFVRLVDRSGFRYPQRYAVVLEQREDVAELVAVEGALRLTDNDRIEYPVKVSPLAG
jgi:hypothetical protein